jgi:putative PIN family toxin of toxin-antitoxin system
LTQGGFNHIIHDMKVVFDTDVMLSGLRSPGGASRLLLIAAWEQALVPLASVGMMIEYEAVLKRVEHLMEIGILVEDVDAFLDIWASLVEPVTPRFSYRPSIKDPDDEIFIEAAINGGADVLVTFNIKDYAPSVGTNPLHGVEILKPGELLRRMTWRPSATTLFAFPTH